MAGSTGPTSKQGIIDDSDVFSIIVDPKDPKVVYASACSGIYKSENGGRSQGVSEGAGDSVDGAANQGADAGSEEPEHRVCRDDGGSVPHGGFGCDLAADDGPEVM